MKKTPRQKSQISPLLRARLASEVLSNEAFIASFAMLRRAYTDKMVNAAPDDDATRRINAMMIRAIDDVGTALTAIVENGKIEAANEKRKEKVIDATR